MASQPPKRRKTSPTTSVTIDAPTSANHVTGGTKRTPRRASFLSPTKASLSRSHPDLLPKPQSVGATKRGASIGGSADTPSQARTRPRRQTTDRMTISPEKTRRAAPRRSLRQSSGSAPLPRTPSRENRTVTSNVGLRTPTAGRETQLVMRSASKIGINGSPRRKSQTPSRVSSPTKVLRTPPPRGMSVRATDEDKENGKKLFEAVEGGLEEIRGLDETEGAQIKPLKEPLGIGQSARTQEVSQQTSQPSRSRAADRRLSPLPMAAPQRQPEEQTVQMQLRDGKASLATEKGDRRPQDIVDDAPQPEPEMERERERERGREQGHRQVEGQVEMPKPKPKPHKHRHEGHNLTTPDETMVKKRKLRDDLRRKLQGLRAEISRAEKGVAQLQAAGAGTEEVDAEELMAILSSHPDLKPPPSVKPAPFSLAAFLPFSGPRHQTLAPASEPELDPSLLPSHYPLPLADPLPHLQFFTPLTFTSRTTLRTAGPRLVEEHTIDVASPQALLAAQLLLTVNPTTATAKSLAVLKLSDWPEPQVRAWLDAKARDAADVSAVCWALGSYYTVARKRALLWWRCHRLWPHFMASDASAAAMRKGKGKDVHETETPSRRELLPLLGCSRVELRDPDTGVMVLFRWEVSFDWTGEAESRVSAAARVPDRWREVDRRGSLEGVGTLFERLMGKRHGAEDIWRAVEGIVGLLLNEG